jgi:hypothetical protein
LGAEPTDWLLAPSIWGGHVAEGLIIRLIIQPIRPDPSGADQIDAEHQATDLARLNLAGSMLGG